ncbi:fungal-specific transcription factor domain-containing protein [Vararia minispora EC-137]|uniref:Fungal-specific transcription factor domain-containing protein n=1 Tax=Vararia minispora EC-137 TaxID=1314806 RepID=A0ACB8QRI1_9AGAM|nr:fungal-specific transcription factor domain-containing protein [Vararia minispora EC-137]
MSSGGNNVTSSGARENNPPKKKRQVTLACDVCRRRKSKCLFSGQENGMCSNCAFYKWECSYATLTKVCYPITYVGALESKVRKLESLLSRLHPGEDFSREVGYQLTIENWSKEGVLGIPEPTDPSTFVGHQIAAGPPSTLTVSLAQTKSAGMPPGIIPLEEERALTPEYASTPVLNDDYEHSDEEDNIATKLKDLSSSIEHLHVGGFYGKSSGAMLYKAALEAKFETSSAALPLEQMRRNFFWTLPSWERAIWMDTQHPYSFPQDDIFFELVDAYFANINIQYPVLHRPTFMQQLAEKLHLKNKSFAGVVSLVCANGARFSSDPRVIAEGTGSATSAGWKWFSQVPLLGNSPIPSSRLCALQIACLGSIYSIGCSMMHITGNYLGTGIRIAVDAGVHRRKVYGKALRPDEELYKRCFWILIHMDRWASATVGRPCAIHEEDFDLEMPVECDDEYWTPSDSAQAFTQPSGKPSYVSAFIHSLKLSQILGYALRTIYASSKARANFGFVGPEWEKRMIANFDSILNQWTDSVPDHLRWDPTREDDVFFLQSGHLYAQYYDLRIFIHRPFIRPQKTLPGEFPSLAICCNAARACSHVIDAEQSRFPTRVFPFFLRPIFITAVVLSLWLWEGKRSKTLISTEREIDCLRKCMRCLEVLEGRCYPAGRSRCVQIQSHAAAS